MQTRSRQSMITETPRVSKSADAALICTTSTLDVIRPRARRKVSQRDNAARGIPELHGIRNPSRTFPPRLIWITSGDRRRRPRAEPV